MVNTFTIVFWQIEPKTIIRECATLEDTVILGQQFGELIAQRASLVPLAVAQALAKYAQKRSWYAAGLIASSYLSGWNCN